MRLASGETLLYSGHTEDGAPHSQGVALMLAGASVSTGGLSEHRGPQLGRKMISTTNCKKDITILMGDFNAKMGSDHTGYVGSQGHKHWARSARRVSIANLCSLNQLVI
ncbi:hypothetical protein NHX12_029218 [Muraenolepis orangiensis]|uniref:Endonuclease/exonuclease/phosphatase domain-containing protein n=1 Tax=Muraenolepis orangiensis TaxID=630683 RepID=A0A9Q0EDM8_9TELE|nr:hypothetical protein NHX12_029218 [Muraenolepis orangiensis]